MRWSSRGFHRNIAVFILLATILFSGCGASPTQPKLVTVAIVKNSTSLDKGIKAFKAGLADQGYVEGKTIAFQEPDSTTNPDELDRIVQKFVDAKVDLIFAPGTTALVAQKLTKGTEIPVVFSAIANPVEQGLVQSLINPGSNITGVGYTFDATSKALEYLVAAIPKAKRILIIYDPTGPAVSYLPASKTTASALGLELVLHEVHGEAETVTLIQNLPSDVDAIYMLPDLFVGMHSADLMKASIDRKLPVVSAILSAVNTGAMLGFGYDVTEEGKQVARIASQILSGIKPSALPVEGPEYHRAVNLKTAQAIGVQIPDAVLREATTIIR